MMLYSDNNFPFVSTCSVYIVEVFLSTFQVSIMQIASDKMVFIFDLIKLFNDIPDVLDDSLTRILQSPRILKLGMRIVMHLVKYCFFTMHIHDTFMCKFVWVGVLCPHPTNKTRMHFFPPSFVLKMK